MDRFTDNKAIGCIKRDRRKTKLKYRTQMVRTTLFIKYTHDPPTNLALKL